MSTNANSPPCASENENRDASARDMRNATASSHSTASFSAMKPSTIAEQHDGHALEQREVDARRRPR